MTSPGPAGPMTVRDHDYRTDNFAALSGHQEPASAHTARQWEPGHCNALGCVQQQSGTLPCTMRFARIPSECKLKYYRISGCPSRALFSLCTATSRGSPGLGSAPTLKSCKKV